MSSSHKDTTAGASQSLDAWFTPWRFGTLLAALISLSFFKVLTGQGTFFYRDFGVFGYPLAQYQRERFWQGELPLWNPLSFCGMPFLAQWNSMTFYPLSLFYLIFPLSWSLGVFNLGHIFLAGVGMYFLARRWLSNGLAASVAGLTYAFNGLMWHSLMWPNNISALGWMPWVVMFVEQAWCEGRRRIVIAALVGGVQMLTGAPEIILLTWVICGTLWLGQFLRGTLCRSQIFWRSAITVILVAGLAAAQLLPFLDLLKHSHRAGAINSEAWAMPFSGLVNFLAPLFHCSTGGGHGVFVQYDQYWVSSYYMGVGTLLLALAGAWRVRKKRVLILTILAVLSVLFALGPKGVLYSILRAALPQLGFMRYPIKFIVVAVFVIPLLAGYATRWFRESVPGSGVERRSLLTVAIVLLCVLSVLMAVEWKYPLVKDDVPAVWRNCLLRGLFLALIFLVFWTLQKTAKKKTHLFLSFSLLLLFWTDILSHNNNLTPIVDRSVYQTGLIRLNIKLDPQPRVGEPRVMQTMAAAEKIRFTSLTNPVDDYLCRRFSLYDNCNLLDSIPKIGGFYSLYLKQMTEVLGWVYEYDTRNVDLKGLKDFLGVAHVCTTDNVTEKAIRWVSRKSSLPLITTGQMPVFSADSNTIVKLTSTDFDPGQTVYLPPEAKSFVSATYRTDTKISSQNIAAERLEMDVEAAAASLVVIAQGIYHPWHAYVDGQRTKIWQANYAFQALEVPRGKHHVQIVYEDNVFHLGLAISAGALVICVTAWVWWRKRAAVAGGPAAISTR